MVAAVTITVPRAFLGLFPLTHIFLGLPHALSGLDTFVFVPSTWNTLPCLLNFPRTFKIQFVILFSMHPVPF